MDSDGKSLYVWQERAADGRWGLIVQFIEQLGYAGPLMTRELDIAKGPFRNIAMRHSQSMNKPVRLARFELKETLEEVKPSEASTGVQ